MLSRIVSPLGLLLVLLFCSPAVADEPPLHAQVDELLRASALGPVAPPTDEATFIRRVSLDLIGRIPTREEVEAFLADEAPDKRQGLIDRLLASDEYPRHMAVVFDLMLMERRGGKHVQTEQFRAYLKDALAKNRSWLDFASEILAADGTDEKDRSAAAFYLERDVAPHLLTRDVGRIFFGIDLQCAQCHDHPLIDDYHQNDYYGLQAFFVRSRLFKAGKKPALIAEQATGEASFQSVFTDREGQIGPKVPGGEELVSITLKPTEQYEVAPAKNVREIPTHSRRGQLAEAIASAPTPAFQRNIVNRLWAHLFGRGLVDPVDLAHSGNPPTHPEVLALLADRFAGADYDIRWLLKELALTEAYQRSFQLPELAPSIDDARQRIEVATAKAEQAQKQSYEADDVVYEALEKLDAAVLEAKPLREAETAAIKQLAEATKARDAAQAKVEKRQQEIATLKSPAEALQKSLAATQAAVEALKDDEELAAALATIQQRAAAHAEQLKQQQAELQKEQAALAETEKAMQESSSNADAAIAARVPAEEKVRQLRRALFEHRDRAQALRTEAALARRDAAALQTLLTLDETHGQIASLSEALAQQDGKIIAQADALAKAETELAQQQSALEQAQSAVNTQQQKLDKAAATLKSVQQTRGELLAAVNKAESALAQLSDADKLTQAVSLLKESIGGVDEDVSAAQAAMEAEQATMSTLQATLTGVSETHKQTAQTASTLKQQAEALRQQRAADQQSLETARAEQATVEQSLIEQSTARGNVFGLTALTPEQMALSMLIATGQYDRMRAAAQAKLDKEKPLPEESADDPAALEAREQEVAAAFAESLKGPIGRFVRLYAAPAGQPQREFFATVDQSLFAANGNEIRSWLNPGGGNLTQRAIAHESGEAVARELYLAILSRPPTSVEITDVTEYLSAHPDNRPQAVQELAWGLLTSVEFRFQH